jgi:diguanylate cyclase (GGDEF)-like protein
MKTDRPPPLPERNSDRGRSAADERDDDADRRDTDADLQDHAGDYRDQLADQRDEAGAGRDVEADRRDLTAHHRDLAADLRDTEAQHRDDTAREQRGDPCGSDAADADPAAAAADREAASGDRAAAARERELANADRGSALGDRRASRTQRQHSNTDRDTAHHDRRSSARARDLASFDGLTGVYLRGPGYVELERDIARAQRTSQSLILAFIDIDGLKMINDTLGHAAGDRTLVDVATALRQHVRSYDLIFRYGGDEFVCVLAGLTLPAAQQRLALVSHALTHDTITIGLAELHAADHAHDLIARADDHLYQQRRHR